MKYQISESWPTVRKIDEDGTIWQIPKNLDNWDYKEFLDWQEAGNTPETVVTESIELPIVISRRQGLLWLLDRMNVMESQIQDNINQITDEVDRYKANISFQGNN